MGLLHMVRAPLGGGGRRQGLPAGPRTAQLTTPCGVKAFSSHSPGRLMARYA